MDKKNCENFVSTQTAIRQKKTVFALTYLKSRDLGLANVRFSKRGPGSQTTGDTSIRTTSHPSGDISDENNTVNTYL